MFVNVSSEVEVLHFELPFLVFCFFVAPLVKVLLDFLRSEFFTQIDLMGFNIHQNNQHLW